MIHKIEVRNFPYLGDMKLNTVQGIGAYNELECNTTNLVVIDEGTPIDGFDILSLILCTLAMDMRTVLTAYFKEAPTFIYLDYEDEGYIYKYTAAITKNGFIKETLHECNSGSFTQIHLPKTNIFFSNISPTHDNFFRGLVYFNYIVLDDVKHLKEDIDHGTYVFTEQCISIVALL